MSDFFCETPDSGEPPCAGVARLRAEVARLDSAFTGVKDEMFALANQRDAMREQVERLEKDAARYQFLRSGQPDFEVTVLECGTSEDDEVWYDTSGAQLDAAIDAALAQAQGEP